MTLIVGCDPSAKKIALVSYETVTRAFGAHVIPLYGKGVTKQTPEALREALTGMQHYAQGLASGSVGQPFAYVEKPLVGRGGTDATIKQAYVGGIIRACLAEAGFTVYDAHPSSWRSSLGITGKGSAAIKAATRLYVSTNWPKVMHEVGSDPDLVDAAAICLYGAEQVRKGIAIAGLAASPVQGRGPDNVVRPAPVRRRVRRP